MKLAHHLFLTVLFLFVFCFSLCAMAEDGQKYNGIVIFGDSLSDNGNLYHTTLGIMPKSPPYYKGRFSNGPTWADWVAAYFADIKQIATANYAVGGETVNFHDPFEGFLPYTFSNSLESYYLHTAFHDRQHTLFIIWLGANDYLHGASEPDKTTNDVMNTIHKNVESLIRSGGKYFLIINLPDLAAVPITSANTNRETLHVLTVLHNQKMQIMIDEVRRKYSDITIQLFDAYTLYADIANNLPAYNQKYHTHIQNVTESCWGGGYTRISMAVREDEIRATLEAEYQQKTSMIVPANFNALAHYIATTPGLLETYNVTENAARGKTACTNPDDYAFWDHVHPTAPVHRIVGSLLIDQMLRTFA